MTKPPEPAVKIWQPRGLEGLELERLDFAPSFDQHVYHTAFEINVLLRGESRVQYRKDFWTGKVTEDTPLVFVQGVDEVSRVMATTPTLVRMRTMRITPELMQGLLASLQDRGVPTVAFPHLCSPDSAVNRQLSRLAIHAVDLFETPVGRLESESALLDLLKALMRHLAERVPVGPVARREHRAVTLIKAYLRDCLAADTSLDDLAALTRLSKFHLLEVFRRDVGVSPHVYQTHLRIHEAKRQLAAGFPIAAVAFAVGFADQSHLNRQFRRYLHGVTPGQYRRDSLG